MAPTWAVPGLLMTELRKFESISKKLQKDVGHIPTNIWECRTLFDSICTSYVELERYIGSGPTSLTHSAYFELGIASNI